MQFVYINDHRHHSTQFKKMKKNSNGYLLFIFNVFSWHAIYEAERAHLFQPINWVKNK